MELQKKESLFKRSLSLGESIGFFITIAAIVVAFYTSVQVRLSALELRMNMQETIYKKIEEKLDRIESKQDNTNSKLNELQVELNNKQDRK